MRTSFHHQPEAQHPKSSAIHKLPADYPIYWETVENVRDVPYGECHAPLRGEPAKLLLMMRFSRDFLDVHARYEVLVAAKGGGL
jgi:hypothetical protein